MRHWLVGGAVIERPEGILLVANRRRGGDVDWSPPGGVIDEGEGLLDGLAREVREETGLSVRRWQGPAYEIEAEAPGLGWVLRVEVHVATDVQGELTVADPDGIVIDAQYVAVADCGARLGTSQPWVVEPLTEYLHERWRDTRRFRYLVEGEARTSLVVTRCE